MHFERDTVSEWKGNQVMCALVPVHLILFLLPDIGSFFVCVFFNVDSVHQLAAESLN